MASAPTSKCPRCGNWLPGEELACICGFDRRAPRREAWTAIGAALFAAAVAAFVWGTGRLHYGGAVPFTFCGVPLALVAVVLQIHGVRSALIAIRGRGASRVLGIIGLLACGAFLLVPVGLFVAARLR